MAIGSNRENETTQASPTHELAWEKTQPNINKLNPVTNESKYKLLQLGSEITPPKALIKDPVPGWWHHSEVTQSLVKNSIMGKGGH